jgi:hypothetical protein
MLPNSRSAGIWTARRPGVMGRHALRRLLNPPRRSLDRVSPGGLAAALVLGSRRPELKCEQPAGQFPRPVQQSALPNVHRQQQLPKGTLRTRPGGSARRVVQPGACRLRRVSVASVLSSTSPHSGKRIPSPLTMEGAKFDLYLELDERSEGIIGRFLYSTDLFEGATIKRMIGHYLTVLEAAAADPDLALAALPLLTRDESRYPRGPSAPRNSTPAACWPRSCSSSFRSPRWRGANPRRGDGLPHLRGEAPPLKPITDLIDQDQRKRDHGGEHGARAGGLPAMLRGHRRSLLLAGRVPRISCGEKCTDRSPRPGLDRFGSGRGSRTKTDPSSSNRGQHPTGSLDRPALTHPHAAFVERSPRTPSVLTIRSSPQWSWAWPSPTSGGGPRARRLCTRPPPRCHPRLPAS